MSSIALWLTIVSFAAISSSVGLTLIVRTRRRHTWVDWYLVYAVCYALWAVIYAYNFFVVVYEATPAAAVRATVAVIRGLISGGVLLSAGMLASRGAASDRARRILAIIGIAGGAGFTVAGVASMHATSFAYLAGINVSYNTIILALMATALVSVRSAHKPPAREILEPVLWISVVFYSLAVATGVVLIAWQRPTPVLSAFAITAYLLPWAIVTLARQSRYLAGDPSGGIPPSFASDHGLTPREFEVVKAVAEGMSNARIAEAQFVSVRTVETHLYNAYRKVGVASRAELLSLLRRIT